MEGHEISHYAVNVENFHMNRGKSFAMVRNMLLEYDMVVSFGTAYDTLEE